MKKLCTVFLACALLFSAFCLFASAEEPTFVFHVNGVNGQISGEDAYIFTTQEAYDNGHPNWAITILLEVQANGLLKVLRDGFNGGGEVPSVTIGDGVVALVVHSSSSDMGQIAQYPNVEEKLAAVGVKEGMYITLEGIDLAAGTGSGTASLYETAPEVTPTDDPSDDPTDDPSEDPSEEPSSEAPSAEEPSSEPAEPSSEEPSAAEETSSQATASTESSAPVSNEASSEAPSDVSTAPIVPIMIIVVAAVVLIAAVVIIVLKRKK